MSITISAPYEDRRSERIMCQLPSVHHTRTEDHNETCQLISVRGQKIPNHVSTTISALYYKDRRSQRIMCQLHHQKIRTNHVSTHQCFLRGQKITTNHVLTTISALYEDRRSQRTCVNYHQCIQDRRSQHHVHTISALYEDRRSQRIMCQLPSVHYTRTEEHNESCVNYHQCTIRGQKITTNHVSTTISASYEDRRSQRIMCQLPSVHHTRTEDHNESCVNYHQCIHTRTEDHNESCVNYHQCILRGQKITTNHVSTTISASYEDRRSQRIMCQLPSVHYTRTEDHNESCVNYHQCTIRGQKITTNHVSTNISASYEDRRSQLIMC